MEKKKSKFRIWFAEKRKKWNGTYEKRLCTMITVNAIAWVWCSYGLALLRRYEIAQSLSQEAVRTILGVAIAYAVKSLGENISKYGYKGKQIPEPPDEAEDEFTNSKGDDDEV